MNLAAAAALVAAVPAGLRWLRVMQREHYLPGAATRFAARWWRCSPANVALATAALAAAAVVAAGGRPAAGAVPLLVGAVGPLGLGVRGRTGPLVWTERLRRLAVASGALVVAVTAAAAAAGPAWLPGLVPLLVPVLVDAAGALLAPGERRRGERWVAEAAARIAAVPARVVAITGSYGKTTTKVALAHLLAGSARVFASPASFNNRMGLARAVNDGLGDDVEVFVAEMGTYGRGEIADLCSWIPPDVAVITGIGPVHLERMGTEEEIVAAKREILADAPVAVLSVDHPLLAAVAAEEAPRRRVVRTSTVDPGADVYADPGTGEVTVGGAVVGTFDPDRVHAGNVASAAGAVVGLGIDPADIADRLGSLPVPDHRQTVARSERGFAIIDDTFNANPAGAQAALARLARLAPAGRRVVVTPGMVELGPVQARENRRLAADAARVASVVLVVGRTNRAALVAGASSAGTAEVIVVPSREEAVAWVRAHLGDGDAVLYENDLPDHYP